MDYMSEIFDMIANANTTLSQTQFSDMLTNALLDTAVKGNTEETTKHQHQEGQGLPPPTMLLLRPNTQQFDSHPPQEKWKASAMRYFIIPPPLNTPLP
jgi:hypothetical protein